MIWHYTERFERWGFVYFAESLVGDCRVKIGFSRHPKWRIQSLGSKRTIRLICVAPAIELAERNLLKRFAAHRITGEWFRRAPELLALANEVAATKLLPEATVQEVMREYSARLDARCERAEEARLWMETRIASIRAIRPVDRAAA